MHLAQCKIVKPETKLRRDIWVGILLVRQRNVESSGTCARFGCAAIRRFHDSWPAAGHDNNSPPAAAVATTPNDASELARQFVIFAGRQYVLANPGMAFQLGITRICAERLRYLLHRTFRGVPLADARSTEHHDRVRNSVLP